MKLDKQRGSALIVSLIMLTSVTFLAILNLQGSTTQIRIVSNMQIKEEMFYTTERQLIAKFETYKNQRGKSTDLKESIPLSINDEFDDQFKNIDTDINFDSEKVGSISSKVRHIRTSDSTVSNSVITGNSKGSFSVKSFEIISEAVDKSERFNSEQLSGFSYLAPAN